MSSQGYPCVGRDRMNMNSRTIEEAYVYLWTAYMSSVNERIHTVTRRTACVN